MTTVLLFLSGMTGCVPGISPQDLQAQLQGGTPPLVIDVRTPGEFGAGHVPGAVNISIFDFRAEFERLKPPKEEPIVVICEHGPRSSFAGFVLILSGYRSLFELEGAMKEWKKNKLPLEH